MKHVEKLPVNLSQQPQSQPVVAGITAATLFATEIATTAQKMRLKFQTGRNLEVVKIAHQEADLVIKEADKVAQKGPGPEKACRKGCCFCCLQPVEINELEAPYILSFIGKSHSKSELTALRGRVAKYQARAAETPPEKTVTAMCPLNVGGNCSIYEARPLVCRGFNSYDAEACKSAAEEEYLGSTPVPYNALAYAGAAASSLAMGLTCLYEDEISLDSVNLVDVLDQSLNRSVAA